jgi:hypothetical protein
MTTDFKASQVQTHKIIVTGSFAGDDSNQLLIYNKDAEDSGSPNQGQIDLAKFDTSGVGSDVFLFVSGGISTKDLAGSYGVTAIGGDLHVSGNLTVDGTYPSGGGGGVGYWFEKTSNLIHTTGSIEVTGSLSNGDNAYTLSVYSHAEGSHTFTTDEFSAIDTIDTGSNQVTVFDDSYFGIGDTVAYIYGASGNNNLLHIAEVTNLPGGNVVELSSTQPINSSAFNAISENEPGAISVLINLSTGDAGADYSHAEGSYTIASGINSHAEGRKTAATAPHSHAEGAVALASGVASHAEGGYTIASGNNSHSEGASTRAYGDNSHAEGVDSIAGSPFDKEFGEGSHAEGEFTLASGLNSHTEGSGTRTGFVGFLLSDDVPKVDLISQAPNFVYAIDNSYGNVASEFSGLDIVYVYDDNSYSTYAYGLVGQNYDSGAGITYVTASDDFSMGGQAPSVGSIAAYNAFNSRQDQSSANFPSAGLVAHSEGAQTTALGSYAHSEGYGTRAIGESSHAEGSSTTATGFSSHSEGEYALALGYGSHAEGIETKALEGGSHSEGSAVVAAGEAAHAEGIGTRAGLLGYDIAGPPDLINDVPRAIYQVLPSGIDFTSEFGSRPTVVLGNNLPYSIYNQNFDGLDTYVTASDTSGWGEYPAYGPIAPIDSTVPGAFDMPVAADVSFGAEYSHAEGELTIAIGKASHTEGFSTYTAGEYSHAEGYQTVTSGTASHAEGINTLALGDGSHAAGAQTRAIGGASYAGGIGTIASGTGQTVIGVWNVKENDRSVFVVGDGKFGAIDGPGGDGRSDIVRINTGSVAGTGMVEVTGSLSVSGTQGTFYQYSGLNYFPTIVKSLTPGYTASISDYIIAVSASSGVGIEFPASQFGKAYIVKDVSGSATTDNISITAAGGALINGSSTYTINSDFGSAQFVYFGPDNGWGTI